MSINVQDQNSVQQFVGDKSKDPLTDHEKQVRRFIESDAGDGTKREDQYLHGLKLVMCFSSLFLCVFLIALDQTIVTTILSIVGNHFGAFDKVGWLSTGFLLSMAVCIQPAGKISIMVGRKYMMLSAILLFEAGSLMCGLASSMNILIGGRVLAGIGAGGIQAMSFVIQSEILPIDKRPIGLAVMSAVFASASVLGPVIGGVFTTKVTWRWAFYINLPIGGVAALVFFFSFHPPPVQGKLKDKIKKFDFIGLFLMISGVVVFLLALTFGGTNYRWGSAAVILCFVLGAVTIGAFIVWNFFYSKNPIVPPNIARIPQVMAAVATSSGIYSFFISSLIYVSVYFQVLFDVSSLSCGLHLLPYIIPVIISAVVGGILIQRTKMIKIWSLIGGVIGPVGAAMLTLLDVNSSSAQKIGLLILAGIPVGLQIQATLISVQVSAPKTPGSTILSTTFLNFWRSLSSALAADLADVVYTTSFTNNYTKAVKSLTNEDILEELSHISVHELVLDNALIKELSLPAQEFVKKQIMGGIRNVFYMGLGLSFISLVGCIFMTNKRLPNMDELEQKASESEEKGEKTSETEAEFNQVEVRDSGSN